MKSFYTSLNIAHLGCILKALSCQSTIPKFSCPCPHISPSTPPHFYRSIPNHLHIYALNARTTQSSTLSCSKCPNHLSLPYSHTLNPKKTTHPHCALCPSATLHTFILPSHYAPTALSRLCRLAISLHCSYLSPICLCLFTRSGYMFGITCPLYDKRCTPNCQMEDTTNSVNSA